MFVLDFLGVYGFEYFYFFFSLGVFIWGLGNFINYNRMGEVVVWLLIEIIDFFFIL